MAKKIRIIIVGNGFGGTYTLRNLHKLLCKYENVEISLVGERNYFLFTPLLHEVATGSIDQGNIVEPIRKVLGHCISDFYLGRAEHINTEHKTLQVGEHTLSYDYLVLAPGATTNFYNTPGAEKHALTLKTLEEAVKMKNRAILQMSRAVHIKDDARRRRMLSFVIVGGGPTGVELAAELQELIQESFSKYYKRDLIADTSVTLVQSGKELLPQFNKKLRTKSLEFLRKKNIKVMLEARVSEVSHDHAIVSTQGGEERIDTETVLWVAGVKPVPLSFVSEVEKTKDGKMLVNEYLQLVEHTDVFALGDAAGFKVRDTGMYLPALAQVAEKEATAVAKNIFLLINGDKPKKFVYKSQGTLVSLGQWMAIGEISNFTFWGHVTWWLWRTVYLSKLISTRKKMKVAMDWSVNVFSPRDISSL